MIARPVTQAEIDRVIEVDVDVACEDRRAAEEVQMEFGEGMEGL